MVSIFLVFQIKHCGKRPAFRVASGRCTGESITSEFIEIQNNIARFDVVNNSNKDVGKITFEVRFPDPSNRVLLKDTVSYQMSNEYPKENLPFLKANDQTFIVQSVPDNCKKAEIKVLEVDYLK